MTVHVEPLDFITPAVARGLDTHQNKYQARGYWECKRSGHQIGGNFGVVQKYVVRCCASVEAFQEKVGML